MRKRVFEPVGAGVALGALIAGLLGQRHNALRLIFALIVLAPFTLGAPEAIRRTAGRLTSRAEVYANLMAAALVCLIGGGLAAQWFAPVLAQNQTWIQQFFPIYEFTQAEMIRWMRAAAALTTARCLTMAFAAEGDRLSLALTELLGGGAILTAMLLSLNTPHAAMYCEYASYVLMGIVLIVAVLRARSEGVRPGWRRCLLWLREVPTAWLRLLLFPLLAAAGTWLCGRIPSSSAIPSFFPEGLSLPVLAGFALCELPRSPFRRDEAGFVGWTTAAAALAALAAAGYMLLAPSSAHAVVDVPLYQKLVAAKAALMVLLAMAAGLMLYAKPNVCSILTMALLLIAAVCPVGMPILRGELSHSSLLYGALAALAASLIAAALYLPEARRGLRLRRIQKMRRTR